MFRIFAILLFLACVNLSAPSFADAPKLAFPLDCTLGKDCWTVNYVDVDPSPDSHKDFKCNPKTYEAHKGTDFALRSRIEMARGVNVLAAMDGTVLRTRDSEDDARKTEEQYQAIRTANKDCGNGVLLEHGSGKQSFYCHLKQGSVLVKPGDEVKEGQAIAQIGQSGFSEFPHLHFAFIWEGGHIDPFTGLTMNDGCGRQKASLWKNEIYYEPYAVFDGGFDTKTPDFEAIKAGQEHPQTISARKNTLVYWTGFYHGREGDKVNITITDPSGRIFAQRETILKENRERANFFYTGRRLSEGTLEPGEYVGTTTIAREGIGPRSVRHAIEVK